MNKHRQHIDRSDMLHLRSITPAVWSIDLRIAANRNKYPNPNWGGYSRARRRAEGQRHGLTLPRLPKSKRLGKIESVLTKHNRLLVQHLNEQAA